VSEHIEIESIRRLDVKPGETLVFTLGRDITRENFDEAVQALESRVPTGVKVLVLSGPIDISVVANSEADRISDAVREAAENPGQTFEVEQ
jgi:hypothetical protein